MCVRSSLNLSIAAMLFAICTPGAGLAQQPSVDGAYRGDLVCEHLPGTGGILRAPLDIMVAGTAVLAARPVFNRDGSLVVGSEIMSGTLNSDGKVHLTSNWIAVGASFKGTYDGTITGSGGTLTGTQVWTRSPTNGGNASRACYGAYVKGPMPEQ